MTLQNFDIDNFLSEYWQKKPLLIRGAFHDWQNPLEPNELAGLACEDDIESRLIMSSDGYEMAHGPFDGNTFAALEDKIYTLLVQAVDHHIPAVHDVLNLFRFIPNWRIDDIMVSYANTGGGVGPHFDQYDVFLLQGLGQRKWQIGQTCDEATALLPHDDLRLMADFQVQDEWVLNAGDILYVPPMLAHNGIAASDDCMTYSIGFRAPSQSELISHYSDHLLDAMEQDERYQDREYSGQDNSGEISDKVIDIMHKMVLDKIGNRDDFARWLGQFLSAPKYEIEKDNPHNDWPDTPSKISPSLSSRFTYIEEPSFILFADGHAHVCYNCAAIALAKQICNHEVIAITDNVWSDREARSLIEVLYAQNSLIIE